MMVVARILHEKRAMRFTGSNVTPRNEGRHGEKCH